MVASNQNREEISFLATILNLIVVMARAALYPSNALTTHLLKHLHQSQCSQAEPVHVFPDGARGQSPIAVATEGERILHCNDVAIRGKSHHSKSSEFGQLFHHV